MRADPKLSFEPVPRDIITSIIFCWEAYICCMKPTANCWKPATGSMLAGTASKDAKGFAQATSSNPLELAVLAVLATLKVKAPRFRPPLQPYVMSNDRMTSG